MPQDTLPDSRAKTTRGRVFRGAQAWVPVFCANCGVEGGLCPETSTFLFWLCNPCFKSKGEIAGTMAVPDKAFYDALAAEQAETFGRPATHQELLQIIAEDSSPLATLIKEAK
jgi:hypothetical protein